MESAGKEAVIYRKTSCDWLEKKTMRKRYYGTDVKLYTNSFCRERAGLKVLMKVASRADR